MPDTTSPRSPFWPQYLPHHLVKPDTTLWANLAIATQRYGTHPAIRFFGRDIPYQELHDTALALAGWLQHRAGVRAGDRVLLLIQNGPQWLMSYYATLRADAVVVPANPMLKAQELQQILQDSGSEVVIVAPELLPVVHEARAATALRQILVAPYADYLPQPCEFELPDWLWAPAPPAAADTSSWHAALADAPPPRAPEAQPDDLALINYTSGSTGAAKGCMHSHRTFMHTTVGLSTWHGHAPGTVFLGVAPMYQVAGLTVGVNCCIYVGGTLVPLPRWDRRLAAALIERYRIHFASIAPAALIDMLSDPELANADLTSLKRVSFGGATMPDSVWQQIHDRLGLSFIEAYGMTETAATTHINPIDHPRRQCAGIAYFDTDARVVAPDTGQPCATGEPGEIVVRGPQLFLGYWQRPDETTAAMITLDGQRYFRTGDIGHVDPDGYFYITDRVKRMINAAGFKVWPAEVENALYDHPAVREACVIGSRDPYRGESVKAVIVLKAEFVGRVSASDIVQWSRERMAAYKYPRLVEFVESLPKSPVGKILWRELQDAENRTTTS